MKHKHIYTPGKIIQGKDGYYFQYHHQGMAFNSIFQYPSEHEADSAQEPVPDLHAVDEICGNHHGKEYQGNRVSYYQHGYQ